MIQLPLPALFMLRWRCDWCRDWVYRQGSACSACGWLIPLRQHPTTSRIWQWDAWQWYCDSVLRAWAVHPYNDSILATWIQEFLADRQCDVSLHPDHDFGLRALPDRVFAWLMNGYLWRSRLEPIAPRIAYEHDLGGRVKAGHIIEHGGQVRAQCRWEQTPIEASLHKAIYRRPPEDATIWPQFWMRANRTWRRVDFVILKDGQREPIAIECDGSHHYEVRDQRKKDLGRDLDLFAIGVRPLRVPGTSLNGSSYETWLRIAEAARLELSLAP